MALFWVAVGLVIFSGRYARVEWMFKGFMVLMTVSLLGTALWVGPNLAGIFKGILTFELPARQGPFGAMVVAMAMVGAVGGSLMNLVYPYFLEQKGWRGPAYRRVQTYDFMLAIGAMILFNLAVWTLGAELVHASGRQIGTLDDLTELLGIVLGNGGGCCSFWACSPPSTPPCSAAAWAWAVWQATPTSAGEARKAPPPTIASIPSTAWWRSGPWSRRWSGSSPIKPTSSG